MSGEPVSHWIERLKAGDSAAAQALWQVYFRRLVGLARARLQGLPRRAAADEEDVALSAFQSFWDGAVRGRFPQLADRDDLWKLLVTLTARKALHLVRDQNRQKRGGGAVLGESALDALDEPGIEQVVGREPSPEFAAQVADECRRLLDALGDAELRAIAVWRMEGDTVEQIAGRLKRAPRTVERKLELIRRLWAEEPP
jgi:DNA-directed RNA polymerase specialized sigma24 family protein